MKLNVRCTQIAEPGSVQSCMQRSLQWATGRPNTADCRLELPLVHRVPNDQCMHMAEGVGPMQPAVRSTGHKHGPAGYRQQIGGFTADSTPVHRILPSTPSQMTLALPPHSCGSAECPLSPSSLCL